MRVTNSTFINSMLWDLNKNMDKLSKLQEQASTSRKINRPSDDPVGLNDTLRLKTGLEELDKYSNNAKDAQSWLDETDNALADSGDVLKRVRELTIQAANGDLDQTDRDAIVKEIKQLKEHLIQVGNSTYAGRYIFSGTKTKTPAYDSNGVYQGNTNQMEYEMGAGLKIPVNVNGTEAFGNMFGVLDNLITDVAAGNVSNLSGTDLKSLDTVIDNQLEVRSDIGARVNRTELIINRADDLNTNMTSLLSNAEDADYAEVTLKLKSQEAAYQAALQVGARIIQPTLLDYLR